MAWRRTSRPEDPLIRRGIATIQQLPVFTLSALSGLAITAAAPAVWRVIEQVNELGRSDPPPPPAALDLRSGVEVVALDGCVRVRLDE